MEMHLRILRGNLYRLLAFSHELTNDDWGKPALKNLLMQLLGEAEDCVDLMHRKANEG